MTGELHEISRAIGGLQSDVKGLGRSLDQMRAESDTEFKEINKRLGALQTAHDEQAGQYRTIAVLWGSASGLIVAGLGIIATKLGLK